MKKFLLSAFVCMIAFVCNAQELKTIPDAAQDERFAIYPGCEDQKTVRAQQKCFAEAVSMHVSRKFNTEIAKKLKLEGPIKMYAFFKVSEEGTIIDIKSRTPHPDLSAEVERVLKTVPKVKPAISTSGKTIKVPLTLPIVFSI